MFIGLGELRGPGHSDGLSIVEEDPANADPCYIRAVVKPQGETDDRLERDTICPKCAIGALKVSLKAGQQGGRASRPCWTSST